MTIERLIWLPLAWAGLWSLVGCACLRWFIFKDATWREVLGMVVGASLLSLLVMWVLLIVSGLSLVVLGQP